MKKLLILTAICLSFLGCKKSDNKPTSKTNLTMQVIVTGARIDYSYNLSCTDVTNWTNPSSPEPSPFWSETGLTTDQTFNVTVHSGEKISFSDTFNGNYNNLPGSGTVATAKLNGVTLMTTGTEESSGGHNFTIPSN